MIWFFEPWRSFEYRHCTHQDAVPRTLSQVNLFLTGTISTPVGRRGNIARGTSSQGFTTDRNTIFRNTLTTFGLRFPRYGIMDVLGISNTISTGNTVFTITTTTPGTRTITSTNLEVFSILLRAPALLLNRLLEERLGMKRFRPFGSMSSVFGKQVFVFS